MKTSLLLVVAVALFDARNHVLMARRPKGKLNEGLWEFPGGKVEEEEPPEDALVREIREELGVTLDAKNLSPLTFMTHDYGKQMGRHVLMPLYACHAWQGTPEPMEGQEIKWVPAKDLLSLDLVPADIPLARHIQELHAL